MTKPFLILSSFVLLLSFTRCESLSKGLDSTFGSAGVVTTSIGSSDDRLYALAMQADGKIVAGGSAFTTKQDFALARFLTDGSLDPDFDSDGKLTLAMGSGDDVIYAVVVLSDNSIFVAGTTTVSSGNTDLILARFHSDGSLDSDFGTGGKITKDLGLAAGADTARALIQDNSGRLLLAGTADRGTERNFAVARYLTTGTADTSFDTDGFTTVALSTLDSARAITLDATGRILVAGSSVNAIGVMRLKTNGSLDTSFDTDGIRTLSLTSGSDVATAIKVRTTGEILVAGTAKEGAASDALLAQFNSDGSTDLSFGSDGQALFSVITTTDRSDTANALVLSNTDKPIFVGKSNDGSTFDWLLGRARFSGSQDFTFDSDGFFTIDFGSGLDEAHAVILQSDGKILVGGEAHNGSNADFGLIRYEP